MDPITESPMAGETTAGDRRFRRASVFLASPLPVPRRMIGMNGYCVVAADGGRARLFTLEPVQHPEVESGPTLMEHTDLVDPELARTGQDLWASTKSGRNRAPGGGPAHGYDDHRTQHRAESERRFARLVAQEALGLAQQRETRTIVLAAEKRMLGFMREALEALTRGGGVAVRELAKDLSKHPPLEVHEHLAREGLLPARRTPTHGPV